MASSSRSLQEVSECGTLVERSLLMTTGCQGENCQRSYFLFRPCPRQPQDQDIVPLLFSVHCYGCTAETMFHWTEQAQEYGFALVIPQGLERAFNAKVCCGSPLHQDVDDKAFFREIQTQLLAQHSDAISSQAIYAVGWSNGGYMVAYAAELFRAIAPISGYQYDDLPQLSPNHPVGMFLHHAADDRMVQATGCCTDPTMPRCCCGISEASPDVCLSAGRFVEQFGETINGCPPNSWREVMVNGIACQTSFACQRNTTYCIHPTGRHFNTPSHEAAFTMRAAIMDFFAFDACQISGRDWDADHLQCSCGEGERGRYCWMESGDVRSSPSSSAPTSASSGLLLKMAVPLLILAMVGIRRYKSNRDRYTGFQVAPTMELGSVEEKST